MRSAPELVGQTTTGSEMSEAQIMARALYHLNGFRACMSQMVAARRDARWIVPARVCNQIEVSIKRLVDRGGPRIVWLPGMPDGWRR